MKLNINDKVKVELTKYGISVLEEENPIAYKYNFDKTNSILTEQLWIVIDIFADYIGGGCEQVFVNNNIYINDLYEGFMAQHPLQPSDLNQLAIIPFSDEDREQFA